MKNIALAIQMYLADNNDTLPPRESRSEVQAFYDALGEGECWFMPTGSNPYLKWPVVLDEYVKNRDVWRCPSAKLEATSAFIWGVPDWFTQAQATFGVWGPEGETCTDYAFPSGWGGDVTDSIVQGDAWGSPGVFTSSIACNEWENMGRKLVSVEDPVNYIICGEGAPEPHPMTPGKVAYPDMCGMECAMCGVICENCWWDWEMAAEWVEEGCECTLAYPALIANPDLRKRYARHLGGVNLGFLDGHASCWNSERLLAKISEGKGTDNMGLSVLIYTYPVSWCLPEGENPDYTGPMLY